MGKITPNVGGPKEIKKENKMAKKSTKKTKNPYATNVDALMSMWDNLSKNNDNGTNKKKNSYLPWTKIKLNEKNILRFLPLTFNNNIPFIVVKEHKGLFPSNPYRAIVCPTSIGERKCPICDYVFGTFFEAKAKYEDSDNKAAKDEMVAMKALMPKRRIYAVVWNKTTQHLEKFSCSWKVFSKIMTEWDDIGRENDIVDINSGYDFKYRLLPGSDGKNSYDISLIEKETPLTDGDDEIQAILDDLEAHKDEILWNRTPLSDEEMRKLIKVEVDSTEDDDVEDYEEEDDDSEDDSQIDALLDKARDKIKKTED